MTGSYRFRDVESLLRYLSLLGDGLPDGFDLEARADRLWELHWRGPARTSRLRSP